MRTTVLSPAGLPREADGATQQPLGQGKVAAVGNGLAKGAEYVGHFGMVGAFGRSERAQHLPAQADGLRELTTGMGGDGSVEQAASRVYRVERTGTDVDDSDLG